MVGLKVPVIAVVMLFVGLLVGVGIGYAVFPAQKNDDADLEAQLRAAQSANQDLTRLVYDMHHPPAVGLSASQQSAGVYNVTITFISRSNVTDSSFIIGVAPYQGVTIQGLHVADTVHHYLAVNDYFVVSGLSAVESYNITLTYVPTGGVVGAAFIAPPQITPVATMTYTKIGNGNYAFTLAGISVNDVNNSSISIQVSPSEGVTVLGMYISGGGSILQAGSYFTVSGLTLGVPYTVTITYLPTSGMIYYVVLTAS